MPRTASPAADTVTLRCGRCAGTGRYGGRVAGGVCFDCDGDGTVTITRAAYDARRRREAARAAAHVKRTATRCAEMKRRRALVRLALEDMADAADAELAAAPVTEDWRRHPSVAAMDHGIAEDAAWAAGDGEGIDHVRTLWIRYRAEAAPHRARSPR